MDSAQTHLTKNITETLDRLLTQLEDLEQLRDELDDDEYQEMREDTENQLKEFEIFLEKNKKENEQLAKEAQKKLEEGKAKSLGMLAMKQKVEGQAADTLRAKLAELKFLNQQKKSLSANDYKQQASKVLLELEKMTKLSEDELALKQQLKNADMTAKQGDEEIADTLGKQLTNYGQNQIYESQNQS